MAAAGSDEGTEWVVSSESKKSLMIFGVSGVSKAFLAFKPLV
jgi:hypothetical protein